MGAVVGWRFWAVGALGVLQSAALVWGSGASIANQLVAVLAAAALGSLALAWIALDRRFARAPLAWVFGLALLLRLIAVQAEPLLEDDHYRYLWDGMRTALHLDPYRLAPSAFFADQSLLPAWQDTLSGINNPDVPSIYGPVLQALFALGHLVAPGRIGAIQALLLAVDLGCMALLIRHGVGARWLLAYALHPLILKEAMASVHPDGLVALWLLFALLSWQRGRMFCTGALLGLAVATKVAALVALPLFLWGPQRTAAFAQTAGAMALGFVAVLVLAYLPFLIAGGSDAAGLSAFATQWRFNPLWFRFVEAAAPGAAARPVAAVLIAGGVAALMWRWRMAVNAGMASRHMALPPIGSVMLVLILLSPVVNPWYALWALGPALCARKPAAAVVAALGCVGVLAYLNGSVLQQAGWLGHHAPSASFAVGWPVALIQMAVVVVAALWVWRSGSGSGSGSAKTSAADRD